MAMPMPEPDVETGTDEESPDSITIPKSVLGDRKCKPGEKLAFTVTDVDEDAGEVEVVFSGYGGGGEDRGGHDEEMDRYPMET